MSQGKQRLQENTSQVLKDSEKPRTWLSSGSFHSQILPIPIANFIWRLSQTQEIVVEEGGIRYTAFCVT